MAQSELGELTGYKQQNIVWIEEGGPKRPQRYATDFAEALQTTREWLLWAEGRRDAGLRYLTPTKMLEKYKELDAPGRAAMTQALEDVLEKQKSG